MAMITTSLRVNGKVYPVTVDPATPVLWILRDIIGLTGTKYGCGIEVCGACTILVDGEAERSCELMLGDVAGTNITTIEGLSPNNTHPVQTAWINGQVPQCGYCQSGMIMATASMLNGTPHPTDTQIDAAITNICVCGTYQRIRAAIHAVK